MLDFDVIQWDEPDEIRGNTWHIAAAGLTPEEVEDVLYSPDAVETRSRSTGRPAVFGETSTGRFIFVVFEADERNGVVVLKPITAYDVGPP